MILSFNAYPTLFRYKYFSTFSLFVLLSLTAIKTNAQWTQVFNNTNGPMGYKRERIKFTDNNHGYFQTTYQLYKTSDAGVSWLLADSLTNLIRVDLSVVSTDTVYALMTNSSYSDMYLRKTTDGGVTWSQTTLPAGLTPVGYAHQVVNFLSGDIGYVAGGAGNMIKTTDGGISWTTLNTTITNPIRSIHFVNNYIGYAAGEQGKIIKTVDAGASWILQPNNNNDVNDIFFTSPDTGFAVGFNFIMKTSDGGVTWIPKVNTYAAMASLHFPSIDTGYASGANLFYRTTDGGETWIAMNVPSINTAYSWIWDVFFTDNNTGYITGDGLGTVYKTTVAAFSCPTLKVDNDFKSCVGQTSTINVTPSAPNNYVYSWSPATDLNNPNIQNPTVTPSIAYDTLTYIVTLIDTFTNCPTSTDTLNVFVDTVGTYQPLPGGPTYIFYLCAGDSMILDLGPGALEYTWNGDISANTQTITVSSQGMYYATVNNCGNQFNYYMFVQETTTCDSVWPGDCNGDLTANFRDILNIGLAYGSTGISRSGPTINWTPQACADWGTKFISNNIDFKHADCDGNGIVNLNDTVAVSMNYGLTHPAKISASVYNTAIPDLQLKANIDTVKPNTLVTVDILLGTASMPIDSIYGLAFRIGFDQTLVDTTLTSINYNSSWMGTVGSNMFSFLKPFYSQGYIDGVIVRNNHSNINGYGKIGTLEFFTASNVSSVQNLAITISNVIAITESESVLPLNMINDSITIDPLLTGTKELSKNDLKIYPNPAATSVTFVLPSTTINRFSLIDVTGRTIINIDKPTSIMQLDLSTVPEGLYFVTLKTSLGNIYKTLEIIR